MTSVPSDSPPAPETFSEAMQRFGRWCRERPLDAGLLVGVIGALIYFFCFYRFATNSTETMLDWAMKSWNTTNDLEHGGLILPAALVITWFGRKRIYAARKGGSFWGLVPLLIGVFAYVGGVRMLQPRIVLIALPFLLLGGVWLVCGREVARRVLFPCFLLFFMVPIGFLLAHTGPLQTLVAASVIKMTDILNLGMARDGVQLFSTDSPFKCEVAGGCSGIRSLMAMSLLSLTYVHFTQDRLWKKGIILAFTLPAAVLGNIARVFSIVLVGKFIHPDIGTGVYHDISGFLITIPVAVASMLGLASLVERIGTGQGASRGPASGPSARVPKVTAPREISPISYDY